MVKEDGIPVLVDFGLMTQFTGEESRETLTIELGRAGTVDYMSPEQIRGEFLDASADLYALGCIMYELLEGLPPFIGLAASLRRPSHSWGEELLEIS